MNNKKGSVSVETVVVLTALSGFAYIMMQFTLLFTSSHQALARVEGRVRSVLAAAETPCLEDVSVNDQESSKSLRVGLGSYLKKLSVNKKVRFVVGEICN